MYSVSFIRVDVLSTCVLPYRELPYRTLMRLGDPKFTKLQHTVI